ncbi:MAG: hypothetical protein R3B70_22480 [Polyangiaceae bacterium]
MLAKDINANAICGTGFPTDEGTRLADNLLSQVNLDWSDVTIDVQKLPSGLLISAFFNGFLQRIYDTQPELLEKARSVRWILKFAFQRENVSRWMADFKPNPTTGTKS